MSKTPLSDAARAAFEPIRAREQAHALTVQAERKKRAEGHFLRVFGVPQSAVLEGNDIVFTVDGKHRLVYVGNLQEDRRRSLDSRGRFRPRFVGAGWMYLEKCGGCKQEQTVAFVGRLTDFGRIVSEGTPEWECQNCNRR